MNGFFYWSGIGFWIIVAITIFGGLLAYYDIWGGDKNEQKVVEEMTNADILNGAASSLEGIERSLNGVKNVIKDGSMMTFSLESKFSSIVAEIENIRKTFVSMVEEGDREFTKKEYYIPEGDSENNDQED